MKLFYAALAVLMPLLFSGCIFAEPCNPQEMTVRNYTFSNKELVSEEFQLDNVTGGQTTNPFLTSNVGNEEFKKALENSLIAGGIYFSTDGKYSLSASIVNEDAPLIGMTFRVTERVRYSLRDQQGQIVYEKEINSSGSASVGDKFVGTHRLRVAKERAVKANIESFLKDLDRNFSDKNKRHE